MSYSNTTEYVIIPKDSYAIIRGCAKCGSKSRFIRFFLSNPSIYQINTAAHTQIMLTFPCFCPYEVKQGKVFYSPTTLSSSRAEVRLASLEAWA